MFPTVAQDLTTFKCRTMAFTEMKETLSEVNIILKPKPTEKEKSQMRETDEHFILTCQEFGVHCRAEKPNGDQLFIKEGLMMDRYSALDTELG